MSINVLLADRQLRVTYANPASVRQLKTIERHLPIRAEQIVGSGIDVFHANPAQMRSIAGVISASRNRSGAM